MRRKVRKKLFFGLIFLGLSVAVFAVRTISEEERNVGLLMEKVHY